MRVGAVMQRYRDWDRDSGVEAYEIGEESITVQFQDGSAYLYTFTVTGRSHVERMITLAQQGDGLNAYINEAVGKRYARRLR